VVDSKVFDDADFVPLPLAFPCADSLRYERARSLRLSLRIAAPETKLVVDERVSTGDKEKKQKRNRGTRNIEGKFVKSVDG